MSFVDIEPRTEKQIQSDPTLPKAVIVIPARMASKRLPGKPLLTAGGKSLVHWTYLQAMKTKCKRVVVATPDREIAEHCRDNGIPWRPTSDRHPNGTSRCLEVVRQMREDSGIELVLNWQVDAVSFDPKYVDYVLDDLTKTAIDADVITFVAEISEKQRNDRNIVKVAVGGSSCAFWFSRAPMMGSLGHCGVYCFCNYSLQKCGSWPPTPLSVAESLEQLTWLEHGFDILAVKMESLPLSIDSQESWECFKREVEIAHGS